MALFQAKFPAYIEVASLTVSVMFHFQNMSRALIFLNEIDPGLGYIEQCKERLSLAFSASSRNSYNGLFLIEVSQYSLIFIFVVELNEEHQQTLGSLLGHYNSRVFKSVSSGQPYFVRINSVFV